MLFDKWQAFSSEENCYLTFFGKALYNFYNGLGWQLQKCYLAEGDDFLGNRWYLYSPLFPLEHGRYRNKPRGLRYLQVTGYAFTEPSPGFINLKYATTGRYIYSPLEVDIHAAQDRNLAILAALAALPAEKEFG